MTYSKTLISRIQILLFLGQAGVVGGQRPFGVALAQVDRHAGQARRHLGLDAKLLQQVEQQPLDRGSRAQAGVQCGVGLGQTQAQAVGGAAVGGQIVSLGVRVRRGVQMRREQRQHAPAAVQAPGAKVQVGLAAEGADGGGAQRFQALLAARGGLGHLHAVRPGYSPSKVSG